jgi:hypothetical protein
MALEAGGGVTGVQVGKRRGRGTDERAPGLRHRAAHGQAVVGGRLECAGRIV